MENKDARYSRRLLIAFAVVVITFVLGTLYENWRTLEIGEQTRSVSTNALPSIEDLVAANDSLREIEVMAARYPGLPTAERAAIRANIESKWQEIDRQLTAYLNLAAFDGERGDVRGDSDAFAIGRRSRATHVRRRRRRKWDRRAAAQHRRRPRNHRSCDHPAPQAHCAQRHPSVRRNGANRDVARAHDRNCNRARRHRGARLDRSNGLGFTAISHSHAIASRSRRPRRTTRERARNFRKTRRSRFTEPTFGAHVLPRRIQKSQRNRSCIARRHEPRAHVRATRPRNGRRHFRICTRGWSPRDDLRDRRARSHRAGRRKRFANPKRATDPTSRSTLHSRTKSHAATAFSSACSPT